jgi:DNA-binding PadR family transcriptional regulator
MTQMTILSRQELVALEDCAKFREYWWKTSSMKKLEALGFVRRARKPDQDCFTITDKGLEYLKGFTK